MAQKTRYVRRIHEKLENLKTGGGQLLTPAIPSITAPNLPSVPEPLDVTVGSQTLLRTTYTPKVLVQVTWNNPDNLLPELYQIQAAKNSAFTSGVITVASISPRVVLELNTNTDYWIRVQAVVRGVYGEYGYPSNYPTVSVHTIGDTTPPGEVSSVTTDWTSGDLEIEWTNPSSDNVFDTRVRIYDTFGGTLLKEVFVPGSPNSVRRYFFTVAENNQVTSNSPLASVYYTLFARSIAHVLSPVGVSGTVTKPKPIKPTGVSDTWASDNGTFDESFTIKWNPVSGADTYLVIVDGVSYITPHTMFTYDYTKNVSDHRPTLVSGDYSVAYTVQARDPLLQISPGASGTALNLAPNSSNLSLNYVPGFSSLYAYVTPTTEIKDLYRYRWVLKSGGVNVQSTISATPEVTFTTLLGNYTLQVSAIDLFGRESSAITASGIILDGLTIDVLRSTLKYTSSDGQTQANLNKLKDGDHSVAATAHFAGSTWQWIKGERALVDRYRTITFTPGGMSGGSLVTYFGYSADDVTYRWFSGPLTGTYGTILTEHATETIARASGIIVSAGTQYRFDTSELLEARFIIVGHRNTTGSYNLREFYPRRLLQSDDGEIEFLKSINIAAGAVTADKISVLDLSAIVANIGKLYIDTTGYIFQGTGDSTDANNAANPASNHVTGLKLYRTSNVGRITTWNNGVIQVDFDTNGRLTAGGGKVKITASGIGIEGYGVSGGAFTPTPPSAIEWKTSTDKRLSVIQTTYDTSGGDLEPLVVIKSGDSTVTGRSRLQLMVEGSNDDATLTIATATLGSLPGSFDFGNAALRIGVGANGGGLVINDTVSSLGTLRLLINGNAQIDSGNLTLTGGNIDLSGNITLDGLVQPGNVAVSYSANLVSIANNGVAALGMSNFGVIFVHVAGTFAMFSINGSNHTVNEVLDPSGVFSGVAGTASSTNIYWSAGNSRYEIENKRGSTLNHRVWIHDAA